MRCGKTTDMLSPEEFWSRVGPPNDAGCMEWLGAKDRDGYGRLKINRQAFRAHRIAYELTHGEFPNHLIVCHECDNPACCNPAHLWLGHHASNAMDCTIKRRRQSFPQDGERNGAAKLNEAQARRIIDLIAAGRNNCQIAREFGVTHANVSAIRRGISWRHLPRPYALQTAKS